MEATSSASSKPVEVEIGERNMMANYRTFIANLTVVSDAMRTCSEDTKVILANYEGISRNVPVTLRPLAENMDLIQTLIVQTIIDMRQNETSYALHGYNADGRGSWRILLKILLHIVRECKTHISQLPVIPRHESAKHNISRRYTQSRVLPVLGNANESLKVVVNIFPTLILVTFHPETLTEAEAKAVISSFYTLPFWYDYDSSMTLFRNLFDLLKLSILNSYKKSNFITRNLSRGLNGFQALITSNRIVTKQADDLGKKNANMKFVKSLWNLAETGLPEKFVSWMKPSIKSRQYFRLTLDDTMRGLDPAFAQLASVRVLYLYHSSDGGIKIPKEWHTHAPYSSKDSDAQQLVASTLVDVEKRGEKETAEKEASKASVKKKLIAEYEESKSQKKKHKKRDKHDKTEEGSHDKAKEAQQETGDLKMKAVSDDLSNIEVESSGQNASSSSLETPRGVRFVEEDEIIHDEVTATSTITALEASSRSSPPNSRESPSSVGSDGEEEGVADEGLFAKMPLEPFLGEEVVEVEVVEEEDELMDITDMEDPAVGVRGSEKREEEKLLREGGKLSPTSQLGALGGVSEGNYDVVLHFHGGGFVSGSPSSHEMYLRTWANTTNAIVLSVDYSLGPEHKFPTAFNECFFVYHWLVTQENALGIRPRKIVLAGDSAGGNLILAVALKAAEVGIRMPDGVVAAYPALNCTKTGTPSRVVFGSDILVPWYFLEVCLDGYVDTDSQPYSDYTLSPVFAPDHLLEKLPDNLIFMVAGFDPLLDDSIRFLRRLDKLNKTYICEIFECPHGFWNFDAVLPEAERAMHRAGNMIRCIFDPVYARSWHLAEERSKRTKAAKAAARTSSSLELAFQPYPARIPAIFTPFTPDEIHHLLTQSAKQKAKHRSASSAHPAPLAPTAISAAPSATNSRP